MVSGISSSSLGLMARQFDPSKMAERLEEMFAKADTDGNGTIDKAEFTTMHNNRPAPPGMPEGQGPTADEIFSEIDTDGDGAITREEMATFDDKMQQRHAEMEAQMASSGTQSSLVELLKALQDQQSETATYSRTADDSDQLTQSLLDVLG